MAKQLQNSEVLKNAYAEELEMEVKLRTIELETANNKLNQIKKERIIYLLCAIVNQKNRTNAAPYPFNSLWTSLCPYGIIPVDDFYKSFHPSLADPNFFHPSSCQSVKNCLLFYPRHKPLLTRRGVLEKLFTPEL